MRKKNPKTTTEYTYTVMYEPLKNGDYMVTVPLLKGLVTYGTDFEEARAMARDAIVCHLEALKKDREQLPNERSFLHEQVSIAVPK